MIWRFSDGTTVELGGNVEGATLLAQRIRAELAEGVRIWLWPPPDGNVPLDVTDSAQLDFYLRQQLDFWVRVRGLKLTLDRPPVPSLPPPPWAVEKTVPGVVY
jgi:hypothetical protein